MTIKQILTALETLSKKVGDLSAEMVKDEGLYERIEEHCTYDGKPHSQLGNIRAKIECFRQRVAKAVKASELK
jgi:hypothetical protein